MAHNSQKKILYALFFVLAYLMLPAAAHAYMDVQTIDEIKEQLRKPQPRITIPGVKLTPVEDLIIESDGQNNYLHIPYLGEYISAIYRYSVVTITIIAVVTIVVAGIQWMLPSVNQQEKIKKAQKEITGAIIGLLIAVGSYVFLYSLNLNLVEFKNLRILFVKKQPMPNEIPAQLTLNGEPGSPTNVTDIPKMQNVRRYPKPNKIRAEAIEDLQKAIEEYRNPVYINFALRTADQQYAIMKKKCGCPDESTLPLNIPAQPNGVQWFGICKKLIHNGDKCDASYKKVIRKDGKFQMPSRAGHAAGNALDMNGPEKSTVKCDTLNDEKLKTSNGVANTQKYGKDYCISKSQQELIKVMIKHGFCVGLGGNGLREPWHFEYTKSKGVALSSFCVKDLNNQNLKKLYYLRN